MMSYIQNVTWSPFMVSLKQNIRGRLRLCGGTVLTQTLTLTAAHCLVYGTIGLYLQFGSVKIFGGQLFKSTKTIVHQHFNESTLAHDIGLVSIFPSKINFRYNIQPVVLPKKEIPFKLQTRLRIFGWGAVSVYKSFSEILRSAILPIVQQDICQFLLTDEVPKHTFCLGYPDGHVDACLGDSGGPAMLGGVQVGLTSFGEGCALPLKPGVYTDLRKYLGWINLAKETLK